MRILQKTTLFALLTFALSGCLGAPEQSSGVAGGLVEVAAGTEPLAPLEEEAAWESAPDCEDRIDGTLQFALAADGRIAALDNEGDVVCVDSVADVQTELADEGRLGDAEDLGDAYLVAIGRGFVPSAEDIAAGDPSPQPSLPYGDPSPQPSMQ